MNENMYQAMTDVELTAVQGGCEFVKQGLRLVFNIAHSAAHSVLYTLFGV